MSKLLQREIERHFDRKIDEIVLSAVTIQPGPHGRSSSGSRGDNDTRAHRLPPQTSDAPADPTALLVGRLITQLNGSDPSIRRASAQKLIDQLRRENNAQAITALLIEQISEPLERCRSEWNRERGYRPGLDL